MSPMMKALARWSELELLMKEKYLSASELIEKWNLEMFFEICLRG